MIFDIHARTTIHFVVSEQKKNTPRNSKSYLQLRNLQVKHTHTHTHAHTHIWNVTKSKWELRANSILNGMQQHNKFFVHALNQIQYLTESFRTIATIQLLHIEDMKREKLVEPYGWWWFDDDDKNIVDIAW